MIAAPALLVSCCCLLAPASAETLTLPLDQRPQWLRRDGIVMAGSWEPLLFRVRRDGQQDYLPTAEQREAYRQEHSPEMVAELKRLGVNFVMMHCYKGGGLQSERESMAQAVQFARLCHQSGLRVGVYNFSGAFLWESFFQEVPHAKDWVVLDPDDTPMTYGRAGYRYYWNRNHPDAQAFYRGLVRFAVQDIGTDLVHFDNYAIGPGRDACSIQRFRRYLQETFAPGLLQQHQIDPATAEPPAAGRSDLFERAWADFCCQSLADSYYDLGRYARTLRPDILVECNPGGVREMIRPPVDHGRLLIGGEAYWDESGRPGYAHDRLQSRIRTCKLARAMDNIAFAYSTTPLEAAEAMAFNLDCLGAICWFEYAKIVERPGSKAPMSPALAAYVRFFHQRRELLRDAQVVADIAVLRSFPSMVFGERAVARLTPVAEDALILNRACFQILYESQWKRLSHYRVAVLAGCAALSDSQIAELRRYVAAGGRLCAVGPLATHDEWMLPRAQPALDDLPGDRVVRVAPQDTDWLGAIRQASGPWTLAIAAKPKADGPKDAAAGLCAEVTEQPGRRLVHLVNYRDDGPLEEVSVRLRLPAGKSVSGVTLAGPEHDDLPLPFRQEADAVTLTVPKVNVYEIAVVGMK